ncbi:MAG: hypothetical protein ABI613_02245, partial [Gemmatimonadota bacterium]
QQSVIDLVLPGIPSGDSSYFGYVAPGIGPSLRISNGLPASDDRAITVFLPRGDSVRVDDTVRVINRLDSAVIALTLQARDTLVTGLKIFLYSVPTDLDSTTTFADISSSLIPANLVDSIVVPDTLHTGLLRAVISGADTVRLRPDTAGRFAIGMTITANSPTGIRIASIAASGSPSLTSYVRVAGVADTVKQKQTINRFPQFTSFVSTVVPPVDPDLLTVGGAPSGRSLIRFALPVNIRDSVTLLRATLELTPDTPILGLPNDPATLQAFGVVGDLGAKSPIISSGVTIGHTQILSGTSGVVSVDVTQLVRLWQTSNGLPELVFLAITPEAASFTRPVFRSTRSASGGPQIRITYYQKFPFERP